jgi:hypothetical protein
VRGIARLVVEGLYDDAPDLAVGDLEGCPWTILVEQAVTAPFDEATAPLAHSRLAHVQLLGDLGVSSFPRRRPSRCAPLREELGARSPLGEAFQGQTLLVAERELCLPSAGRFPPYRLSSSQLRRRERASQQENSQSGHSREYATQDNSGERAGPPPGLLPEAARVERHDYWALLVEG